MKGITLKSLVNCKRNEKKKKNSKYYIQSISVKTIFVQFFLLESG